VALTLLDAATALSALSLFFHLFIGQGLIAQAVFGYVPILLGFIVLWLCWRARGRTRHKTAVVLYAIFLAPFAFSYPAWIFFIWVWYRAGAQGPLP
jgi:hypothetical protein